MNERPNILVVCARNKQRSRTAEYIFKNDSRFSIRSVGLSPKSNRKITEGDLAWANLIFVMEYEHKARIAALYRHLEIPRMEVLNIEDDYAFLDPLLVKLLMERINASLQIIYTL